MINERQADADGPSHRIGSLLEDKSFALRGETSERAPMGAWGATPTENDAAADWLVKLFDDSDIESRVRRQLERSVHDEPGEIRAAAHWVSSLIQADLWPSNSPGEFKGLASSVLQRMLDERVFTSALMVAEIRNEIRRLESPHGRGR